MLEYLLKSGVCMAVLLLFYKLLLEKENMHVFKRFFLLSALLLSFIIPSLVFVEYVEPTVVSSPTNFFYPDTQTTELSSQPTDMDVINWPQLLWTIYFIGLAGFGFRFLKHLFQIINRIRVNPKLKQNFNIKVLLKESLPPHTFFSYIFLNKNKFEEDKIPKSVLTHEETHAKQYHSLDVLFIELLQVVFWFNPLVYLFKKSIKLNHEFLADSAVLKSEKSTSNYQNTLLSYLSRESLYNNQSTGMANAINYSSIKKRFTIMKKRTSKKSILVRSFLLLPLIALLLFGFSERKVIEREQVDPVVQEITLLVETIELRIDGEGNLFLQNKELITLENLKTYLLELNSKLSKEQREQHVKAIINVTSNTPNKIIEEVDQILMQYGVAQIDVLGPEPAYSGNQIETVTEQSEIKKYNALAKKYNAVPIAKRKIPLKDLKVLETIYKRLTKTQRKEAQPFPECLPKNEQDGASRKQMAEYNKLARHYNEMSSNYMRIIKEDVERLEYIYSLMSDKQKEDAEPFPDFPEPPAAPKPPKTPNDGDEASIKIKKIIEEQDPYDVVGNVQFAQPKQPEQPINPTSTYIKDIKTSVPPLPPEPLDPLDSVIEMAKEGATFYYKGKKITSDKAIDLMKKDDGINIDSRRKNGIQEVRLSKEPIIIE